MIHSEMVPVHSPKYNYSSDAYNPTTIGATRVTVYHTYAHMLESTCWSSYAARRSRPLRTATPTCITRVLLTRCKEEETKENCHVRKAGCCHVVTMSSPFFNCTSFSSKSPRCQFYGVTVALSMPTVNDRMKNRNFCAGVATLPLMPTGPDDIPREWTILHECCLSACLSVCLPVCLKFPAHFIQRANHPRKDDEGERRAGTEIFSRTSFEFFA